MLVATDVAARGRRTSTMWTWSSTTTSPTRTSTTSTASAAPAGPSATGVAYTLVSTITEAMRMDDIQKITKNQVHRLKYEKGTLLDLEEGRTDRLFIS